MFANEEWDDNDTAKSLKTSLFSESHVRKIPCQRSKPNKKRLKDKCRKRTVGKQDNVIGTVHMRKKEGVDISKTKDSCINDPEENRVQSHSVETGRKRRHLSKPNTNYRDSASDEKKLKAKTPLETEKSLSGKNLHGKSWKKSKLSGLLADSRCMNIKQQSKYAPDRSTHQLYPQTTTSTSRSGELRKKVTEKLQSAQFRFINEQLYSRSSKEAWSLFRSNHNAYLTYHQGFSNQVSKWPVNPLDMIISFIKKRPSHWIVADFGCGDARLAKSVKNKVYSFDLVSENERVTVADIANVPLDDNSIDVAVFCLSLMGTNFADFLAEANRTLKLKGWLKIAEVASRFTSISKFVALLKKMGFELEQQNRENTHFYAFDFRKIRNCPGATETPQNLLKPCLYKKR